jgi:Mg/Co/Ni transporter MgtE
VAEGLLLSLRFVEQHPREAAAVLEAQPPETGAAFLSEIPARVAARTMAGMLPFHAARCLRKLEPEIAASLLAQIKPAAGSAMLRQVSERRAQDLIARLPGRRAAALRVLLGYPVTTVGAWMDARVPLLSDDDTVGSAIRRLRREDWDLEAWLHVVDRERRLQGRLRSGELLRGGVRTPLRSLLQPAPTALSARSDLLSVRALPAWDEDEALPVVRRNGEFVGLLRYAGLQRGLQHDEAGDPYRGPAGSLLQFVEVQWQGLAHLLEAPFRATSPRPDQGKEG